MAVNNLFPSLAGPGGQFEIPTEQAALPPALPAAQGLPSHAPQTPEQVQQNVSAWQKFLEKARDDEDFRNMLFQLGASLTNRAGQGGFGQIAAGVNDAAAFLTNARKERLANTRKMVREDLEDVHTRAQIAGINANTAGTLQQTQERQDTAGVRRQAITAETAALLQQSAEAKETLALRKNKLQAEIDLLKAKTTGELLGGGEGGKPTDKQLLAQSMVNKGFAPDIDSARIMLERGLGQSFDQWFQDILGDMAQNQIKVEDPIEFAKEARAIWEIYTTQVAEQGTSTEAPSAKSEDELEADGIAYLRRRRPDLSEESARSLYPQLKEQIDAITQRQGK